MENVRFDIKGMSCQGCVARASVAYDATRTEPSALKAAIEDAGYGVAA